MRAGSSASDEAPAVAPRRARFAGPARSLGVALLVACAAALLALVPRPVRAFGEEGAFNPRILLTGNSRWEGLRTTAPARWSRELVGRTSAPARSLPTTVRADDSALLAEPFAVWGGSAAVAPLTDREVRSLRRFITLGGVLLVDDFEPDAAGPGAFGRSVRRELERVIPSGSPIAIGPENVIFRSFYLLQRAVGRVEGPPKLEAIVRGGAVQVVFSSHDLLGALAQSHGDVASLPVVPGGEMQRERAVRLAVNVAMYVLCSNYKDDQVHAPFLMKRRPPKGAP